MAIEWPTRTGRPTEHRGRRENLACRQCRRAEDGDRCGAGRRGIAGNRFRPATTGRADRALADTLSWRLLRDLVGRRRWLAGIGATVAGQILGAVALGAAAITVVEPLLTMNVLFELGLARLLSNQRLRRHEWGGALALAVGVALFVVIGDPHPGGYASGYPRWLFFGCTASLLHFSVSHIRRSGATLRRKRRPWAIKTAGRGGTPGGRCPCSQLLSHAVGCPGFPPHFLPTIRVQFSTRRATTVA